MWEVEDVEVSNPRLPQSGAGPYLLVELRLLLVAEVEEGEEEWTGGKLRSREWSRSSQRETTMCGVETDVKCGQDST